MDYPYYTDYRVIYARFFKRSPAELLERAGIDLAGAAVLDLCGGDGRLSFLAAERGARVTYVDESPKMAPIASLLDKGVDVHIKTVTSATHMLVTARETFDIVTCQQGINYWFERYPLELISKLLATPQSSFVFNTFNQRPSSTPTTKEYYLDNHKYVEVSYCGYDNVVHHVQVCDGFPPHVTSFKWIEPAEIRADLLRSGFSRVEERHHNSTTIWKAQL